MPMDLANLSRGDMKMIAAAVRRGFKFTDEMLDAMPMACAQIMADRNRDDRNRLAAIKCLIAMHVANIRLFEAHLRAQDGPAPTVNVGVALQVGDRSISEDRLAQIAAQWGVSVDIVRDAIRGPGSDPASDGGAAGSGDASTSEPA